jgi:competence CoiA-like predicted nuclease
VALAHYHDYSTLPHRQVSVALQPAIAFTEPKSNGPFLCPECAEEVVFRLGTVRLNRFADKAPTACR